VTASALTGCRANGKVSDPHLHIAIHIWTQQLVFQPGIRQQNATSPVDSHDRRMLFPGMVLASMHACNSDEQSTIVCRVSQPTRLVNHRSTSNPLGARRVCLPVLKGAVASRSSNRLLRLTMRPLT
jgi:hypothetical protein